MKKLQILLPMAAVLLSLTGCKKDNEKSGPSGETVTLSATLGGGEKTEIDGFDMKWSAGDAVNINRENYTAKFALGYETAIFENVKSADKYEAYYPASLYDKDNDKYVLPSTQTYNAENCNILSGINPMYAETETKELHFNHICALVKLQVTGTGTVKTITVTSSKPLSGAFEIVDNHAVIISKDAASLTLKCDNEGVELSNDVNNPTIFYIAVPQNDYDDLQFTLSDGTNTWSPTSPAVKLLEAGKLYTKSLENVEFKKPAVFSVSATTTVEFAPGNLYYNGADNAKMNAALPSGWNFYEHQWDCYPSGTSSVDESMEINLFTWGYGEEWSTVYNTMTYQTGINVTMTDWGSVAIGGDPANTWRTLNRDEWNYLLGSNPEEEEQTDTYGRPNAMNLCAWVTLTDVGVSGLVILPDNSTTTASSVTTKDAIASSGAVFLPTAGYRYGTDVSNVGYNIHYWSSTPTPLEDYASYALYLFADGVGTDGGGRMYGHAVRLVR